jgi:LacI family transcriptional regulator
MKQRTSINLKELASQLNLSVTTVSRVLNGKAKQYRIKAETEQRVREAANIFHYSPNQFARSLKLDKSETIGVIVPDISNPFFSEIVKNIERESKNRGYAVFIGDSSDNTTQEIALINYFTSRKVDGLIIAPVGLSSSHLNNIYESGMPVVIIDRSFNNVDFPVVTSNNYQGAYDATFELLKNGHTKIALIQGLQNSQPNTDRVMGYVDAMKQWNIPHDKLIIVGNSFSIENGFIQATKLLQTADPPTAIFALSNLITLGVLKAVSDLGLVCPDSVSLVSFDEQAYSAFLNTPMTTIEQNREEIGLRAVNYVLDQINGLRLKKGLFLKIDTKIHLRKSIKNLNE